MTNPRAGSHQNFPDPHQNVYAKTIFGFWLYLLTDFMMFAALFATYAVLRNSTYGGPAGCNLFNLPLTLLQTLILLVSSFTSSVAATLAQRNHKSGAIGVFILTFLLGSVFLWMQLAEFTRFIDGGNSWERSAFLSAFFTLVGTHMIHVILALLWIIVLLIPVFIQGLTANNVKRLTCLKIFWQFLNVVWVFIFTFVYLMG